MIYIKVPDMHDSFSSISIDGKQYFLRFTYNEKYDYWNFGLYDDKRQPIVPMTKIVPNYPLLFFYQDVRIPDGTFGCISDKADVGRESFNNKEAEFVYIPNKEVEV